MKKCIYCGAELADDDNFCFECGKPVGNNSAVNNNIVIENDDTSVPKTNVTKYLIIGLVALLLIGGGWYGYKEYSAYNEKKQAREKFIADSLEQVRKDSIKLAEQKEQERIEAEKIAEFRKKLSFENFLGMLNHYDKESYANKCGLSFLYKDVSEEGFIEIVYGYDVEKGAKKEPNGRNAYQLISKSNHACYFIYIQDTSTSARLSFQDKEDADFFFNKAKEYGMIQYQDNNFIPSKKTSKVQFIDELDDSNSIYEIVVGTITPPTSGYGWYDIHIGLDF